MKINEQNFLKQLRRKNEKALLYIIDEYSGLLHAIVRKHLYAFPDKQEECLNDIFLAIWEHADSYDESLNSFKNWIGGVARYKALDYVRKYLRDPQTVSLDDSYAQLETAGINDFSERILQEELSEELQYMLSCLKPDDRQLFLRLFYDEMSIEEISEQTGMKREVLYNRVSRGKKKIRQHFLKSKGVSL